MNLIQAMKRLSYTIGNGHKANDKDVDALNAVIEWVNKTKEERLHRNHHFCKMSMFVYNEFLIHYKGDNQMCETEIQKLLEQPLSWFYERFYYNMRMFSLNNFFDHIGAKDDSYNFTHTLDELREQYKNRKELFAKPDIQDLFKEHLEFGMYSQEEITVKLNHFLSEIIVKYEDKKHDLQWMEKYLNKKTES